MEKNIEIRKAEKPSEYLARIPRADDNFAFFCDEVEKDSKAVYEIVADGEVVGLANLWTEADGAAVIFVFIFSEHRGKGYSYPTVLAAEEFIKTEKVNRFDTVCAENDEVAKRLATKCGYIPKYASAIMRYNGAKLDEKVWPIRAYRDADFLEAYTLTDEAFYKMHLETGLFPNAKRTPPNDTERKYWRDTAAEMFVYEQDGEIVGCGRVCANALSFVAIKTARQGAGFGKNFVIFLTNRILEKGEGAPRLWCVVANDKARKLYEHLGYRETARTVHSEKKL